MVEEPEKNKEKIPFIKKLKESESLTKGARFVWKRRIEILSGLLVFIGLVLSFFYVHLGGLLVGLGFGICFYEEIYNYFLQVKEFYTGKGLFKTLVWIATILFFLIAIPAFILAAAIGFGLIFLLRQVFKK